MKKQVRVVLQRLPEPALSRTVTYDQRYEKEPSEARLRAYALEESPSGSGEGGLHRLDLAGIDGHDLRLYGLDLRGSSFAGANLRNARFENCILDECSFDDADLRGAAFFQSSASNASFGKADLSEAKFKQCRFERTAFGEANLQQAHFEKSTLDYAEFFDTELYAATFENCIIGDTQFGAISGFGSRSRSSKNSLVIEDAKFLGNKFDNVEFFHCVLRGVLFDPGKNGEHYRTVFTSSLLDNVDLHGDFSESKFKETAVDGSRFKGVNLRETDFDQAAFDKVQFEAVNFTDCRHMGGALTFKDAEFANCEWPKEDEFSLSFTERAEFIGCDRPVAASGTAPAPVSLSP